MIVSTLVILAVPSRSKERRQNVMANQEQLAILRQGVEVWNQWREEHSIIKPCLSGANLSRADLSRANLIGVDLSGANLMGATLEITDLSGADLTGSYLTYSNLHYTWFMGADLRGAHIRKASLVRANLDGAKLNYIDLSESNLTGATLNEANLTRANLSKTDLTGVELIGAHLSHANLSRAILVETNLTGAILNNCNVYGVSVWSVQLEGATQSNLVITSEKEPTITVDNLKIAQFIYLLLNNVEVREVIDTITSQVVLILGRFSGERKTVLEILKHELRTQNYSPVAFDFEESGRPDFRETVRTLANMARFVLIDLTDLENVLDEIVKVVPYCRVPIQPFLFLDNHQYTYNQFLDLRHKHRWVLPLFRYQDNSDLLASFQEKIIQPAKEKSEELKQREPVQVFFWYAQKDAGIFVKLKKHLSLLERSGQIAMWDDQKLAPGEEKEKEIEKRLSDAHIILLLISPDFLSSHDCVNIQEMAMERYEKGNATIIPLIIRPCGWQFPPLSKLQMLPRDEKPLVRRNLDSIPLEVTNDIADVIKELL
jgi:uncharacterized protein YjbI with pentapeptide repeats